MLLQFLAVPMGCEVQVFETDTWELAFSLTDDSIKEVRAAAVATSMEHKDGMKFDSKFRIFKPVFPIRFKFRKFPAI